MKPLIIGEAPSKNEVTPRPLEGRVGKRLSACCGLSLEAYMAHFDRMNIFNVRQDTAEHGFQFDMPEARRIAANLQAGFQVGQLVILLGKRVGQAFGYPLEYFAKQCGPAEVYIVPHPSGINRWWNDERNVEKMHEFMKEIVRRTR